MFPVLQSEVEQRFEEIAAFYRAVPKSPATVGQTCRGLVFVQAYAVYEHTVRTAIRYAIEGIAAKGHSFKDLKPSLLAVFLDPEMKSLRDVGERGVWESRMHLVKKACSTEQIAAVEVIPHDGNYYRHTQLQMTFDVLGVTRAITTRKRYRYTIDEVVNVRNEIAHGKATPAEVGQRYSYSDARKRIATMRRVCLRIIKLLSEHCVAPERHIR